jgi:hypothetical protein
MPADLGARLKLVDGVMADRALAGGAASGRAETGIDAAGGERLAAVLADVLGALRVPGGAVGAHAPILPRGNV